ncbi:MAG: J domain-containing protein, partial [Chloroflexi bacterium]
MAGLGCAVRGASRRDRSWPRPCRERDGGTAPRPGPRGRPGPRDPLRRSRGVARRQVHRRRAARHAPDPDGQPPIVGRGWGGGDDPGNGRAFDRAARRGRGLPDRLTTAVSLRDVPADDLYARLELPLDAAPEAIEIAWRSLLKRHHPDVAGESSLEAAKRINVAHDWLSDPDLRARYDRARGTGPRAGYAWTGRGRGASERRAGAHAAARPAERRRDADPLAAARDRDARPPDLDLGSAPVGAILDRAARLTADELDRLALAEQPPIAFIASIRRFLPPDRRTVLDGVEATVARRLPDAARARPGIADAVTSVVQVLVLDGFLA